MTGKQYITKERCQFWIFIVSAKNGGWTFWQQLIMKDKDNHLLRVYLPFNPIPSTTGNAIQSTASQFGNIYGFNHNHIKKYLSFLTSVSCHWQYVRSRQSDLTPPSPVQAHTWLRFDDDSWCHVRAERCCRISIMLAENKTWDPPPYSTHGKFKLSISHFCHAEFAMRLIFMKYLYLFSRLGECAPRCGGGWWSTPSFPVRHSKILCSCQIEECEVEQIACVRSV